MFWILLWNEIHSAPASKADSCRYWNRGAPERNVCAFDAGIRNYAPATRLRRRLERRIHPQEHFREDNGVGRHFMRLALHVKERKPSPRFCIICGFCVACMDVAIESLAFYDAVN